MYYSAGTGIWCMTCSNGWIPSYHNPDEGETTIHIPINYDTVCQYTGLKDDKGVKMFEGDTISYNNDGLATVKFHGEIGFYAEGYQMYVSPYSLKECKVIGNIHDKESK